MAEPNNGDGNGKNELKTFDKLPFLDEGSFDSRFTGQNLPNALEKFIERGDKVEDLLLRGWFRDEAQIVSFTKMLMKARLFRDKTLEEYLLNWAAASPSKGGERIHILLQAVVGRLDEQKRRSFGNRLKEWAGIKDKPSDGKD